MKKLSELFTKSLEETFNQVTEGKKKKVDFEFQALGLELQEMFPDTKKGAIWGLFYNPKFTEAKIRDSMKAYRQQGVRSFAYFMGILHKK